MAFHIIEEDAGIKGGGIAMKTDCLDTNHVQKHYIIQFVQSDMNLK